MRRTLTAVILGNEKKNDSHLTWTLQIKAVRLQPITQHLPKPLKIESEHQQNIRKRILDIRLSGISGGFFHGRVLEGSHVIIIY